MLIYIIVILLSFAVALGIVLLWEKSWAVFPASKTRCVVLYPVKGHREDVEYLLRALLKQVERGNAKRLRILIVDCGMDEETRRICSLFLKDNPELELCGAQELSELVSHHA